MVKRGGQRRGGPGGVGKPAYEGVIFRLHSTLQYITIRLDTVKITVLSFLVRYFLATDPWSNFNLRYIKSRGPLVIRVWHVQRDACPVSFLGSLVLRHALEFRMRASQVPRLVLTRGASAHYFNSVLYWILLTVISVGK